MTMNDEFDSTTTKPSQADVLEAVWSTSRSARFLFFLHLTCCHQTAGTPSKMGLPLIQWEIESITEHA